MTLLQAIILGIIQGLTEFLPISSSGHLILGQSILGINDMVAMKGFDIAVHFGTLLAIFLYFRKDFAELIVSGWRGTACLLRREAVSEVDKKAFTMIQILLVGTIPAVAVGLIFGDIIDQYLLNPLNVTMMLAIVAVVFLMAESYYKKYKNYQEIGWKEGMLIGVAQALALIPGVSRSGATITSGLFLGVERSKAARFSFILGSVAMVAATAYALFKVAKGEYSLPAMDILITGIVSSFISGWLAISFLLNYLKKHTLAVFAWYRLALVAVFWAGWLWF
jgi:undecaprenyl-diphosphatase